MTLIEIIRKAVKHDFNYVVFNPSGGVYAYTKKPTFLDGYNCWNGFASDNAFICENYKLTCDPRDALIKISDLKIDVGQKSIFGRIA